MGKLRIRKHSLLWVVYRRIDANLILSKTNFRQVILKVKCWT